MPAPIQSATLSIALGTMSARVSVAARQRVPVGNEVETIELGLQPHPVLQRADEMSEMEFSGRAHARHHAFGHVDYNNTFRMNLCNGRVTALRTPLNRSTYRSTKP